MIPFLVAWILSTQVCEARPISYSGGISLMNWNQADLNIGEIAYSWLPNLSSSFEYVRWRDLGTEREFYVPKLNWGIRRWNTETSQANLYLSAGYGYTRAIENGGAAYAALEADWESREYYLHVKYERFFGRVNPETFSLFRVRAGLAPYVTEFAGLHAWVLLQYEKRGEGWGFSRPAVLTPLLRLVYRNLLFELGSSFRGDWSLNWMIEL